MLHLKAGNFKFLPSFRYGITDFGFRNVEILLKAGDELLGEYFLIRKGHKRIQEFYLTARNFIDIILDVLRVGRNDRAVVVVVCIRKFITLVRNRRVENKVNVLVDQPRNMSVRKLRRITLGLTRDGVDTELIDLACGLRREHNGETELLKESSPERIIFIHI